MIHSFASCQTLYMIILQQFVQKVDSIAFHKMSILSVYKFLPSLSGMSRGGWEKKMVNEMRLIMICHATFREYLEILDLIQFDTYEDIQTAPQFQVL